MLNTIQRIRERLAVLAPTLLEIADDSALHAGHVGAQGGGGHYRLTMTAKIFENKPLLHCHRLIYQSLGELMQQEIHALSITIKY